MANELLQRGTASTAPYRIWGTDLEPDAVEQLKNACTLPVAVSGALMPDAHVGYGLSIGGVLATNDAVIPYAVAHIRRALGAEVLLDLENHHNFAWRERHRLPDGRDADVIVHRKGATPAGAGVLGIIPGSMATPGYIVRGKGVAASLNSAAHGAGRRMSRTKARQTFKWDTAQRFLRERGVTLLSAGLDEVPMAYKDIDEVMAAQHDLVEPLARFEPRLVKMAPSGEPPED